MDTFIITGAAGGIGIATLRAMARADRRLVCVDIDQALLDDRLPKDLPGELVPTVSRLENMAECERVVADCGGEITGVVHLAGRYLNDADAPDSWDTMIDVNLRNAYELTQAVLPKLRSDGGARVVYASSGSYRRGTPAALGYSAAKAGVVGIARALAKKLGPKGTVNAIAPGPIDTPLIAEEVAAGRLQKVIDTIPLGRVGQPEDVAELIAFLCSEKASYITAQTINIDGGLSAS